MAKKRDREEAPRAVQPKQEQVRRETPQQTPRSRAPAVPRAPDPVVYRPAPAVYRPTDESRGNHNWNGGRDRTDSLSPTSGGGGPRSGVREDQRPPVITRPPVVPSPITRPGVPPRRPVVVGTPNPGPAPVRPEPTAPRPPVVSDPIRARSTIKNSALSVRHIGPPKTARDATESRRPDPKTPVARKSDVGRKAEPATVKSKPVRSPEKVREPDRTVCKPRPKENTPKGGGGGPRKFVPWC